MELDVFFCVRQTFSVLRSDEIKMTTLLFMRQQPWEPFTSSIPISKVYIFTCRLCILIFSTDQCFVFFAALPILFKEKKGFELKVSPSAGLTHKLISNSNWADLTSTTLWCDCHHFLLATINVCLFGTLPTCQHGLHPVSWGQKFLLSGLSHRHANALLIKTVRARALVLWNSIFFFVRQTWLVALNTFTQSHFRTVIATLEVAFFQIRFSV